MAWPAAPAAPVAFGAAPAAAAPATQYDVPGAPTDCISSLAFTPKGAAAVALSATAWDKTVRVWTLATQAAADQSIAAVQATAAGQQTAAMPLLTSCFAKDGRCFYGGCDKAVTMWSIQTGQTQQVGAHDQPVSHIEYVEEGVPSPMLISSGWDGKVRFWDLRSPTPAKEEDFQAPILHFDASTAPLATFLASRKAHVYQLSTLTRFRDLDPVDAARFQFRKVCNFKDQSAVAACTVDGRVVLWPLAAGQQASQMKCHGGVLGPTQKDQYDAYPVNFVGIHPTAKKCFTAASDGSVKNYDLTSKAAGVLFKEQPTPVSCGALDPNGTMLAFGLSYDWSLGKEAFNPAGPTGIKIHAVTAADLAPKK